jgi:hypothetical protein
LFCCILLSFTLVSIPGDLDAVNMLITHLDRSESIEYLKDAHVPSSALKLWFRELGEPLIPKNYYDKAIDVWQPLS